MAISTQHVQCVLLFLVLAVNSAQFQILCSYMLLLKSPILMRSCVCLYMYACFMCAQISVYI